MSNHMPMPSPTRAPEPAPQLVRHKARPVWGCGALVRNAPTKRAYQFEDGRTRTFKKGFYHLLEPVDLPEQRAERLAERLIDRADTRAEVREAKADVAPVDQEEVDKRIQRQIAFFLEKFPEGFAGDAWRHKYRGQDGRRLKRHRDPVLEAGAELLAEKALRDRVEADDAVGLRDDLLALLETTDVVTPARRRALKSAKVTLPWLETLVDLLYGETAFAVRFERWVAENERLDDKMASWSLVTVPLALAQPDTYMAIRYSRMKHQVEWVRPGMPLPKRPGAPSLEDVRKVLDRLLAALDKAGHVPADRFGVYDFIQLTTTTKAREAIG